MSQIVLSLGFGLVTASILALGAVGFTLQFGVTNLFNLAFGETMTVAAFVAYLAMAACTGTCGGPWPRAARRAWCCRC